MKRFVHVYFRQFVLGLVGLFLRTIYGMDIHKTARLSLKCKLDKTNPKGVHVGAGSYVAFGATILTHDMCRSLHSDVYVGRNCFIGANSILMPGVVLGDSVIVAAGAVVTKSFAGNCILAGNPAVVIKTGISTGRLGILIDGA